MCAEAVMEMLLLNSVNLQPDLQWSFLFPAGEYVCPCWFKLNDFAGKRAVQFHMWHLCTWSDVSGARSPSVSKYSCITKAGTTWLFHIAWAKIQQKKNLLKIQGKLPRSSWTLGYLVEFSSPLKSLNQNAQSIRILRTNLSLSTWELIFHLSFLWIHWKVIIPSVLSV